MANNNTYFDAAYNAGVGAFCRANLTDITAGDYAAAIAAANAFATSVDAAIAAEGGAVTVPRANLINSICSASLVGPPASSVSSTYNALAAAVGVVYQAAKGNLL